MKKNIDRNPKGWKRLYYKKGKIIVSKNFNTFFKKYNAHCPIRMLPSDYKLINKNKNRFTHFNILNTTNKPRKTYIILKIVKPGSFDGKIYKSPILDINNFILVKCISAQNKVQYRNLNKEDFKYSLSNLKNVKDLKKAMTRRYKKSLGYLSNAEKLSLGVAITKFKIIKRY